MECKHHKTLQIGNMELKRKCALRPEHNGGHRAVLIGDTLMMWMESDEDKEAQLGAEAAAQGNGGTTAG